MPKSLKHFLLGLSILLGAVACVLFVPPVSRFVLERTALHFLGHHLHIRAYHLTPARFYIDGVFDDNTTLRIDATRLLSTTRHVKLQLDACTSFFNKLAGAELPAFDFNASAEFADGRAHADVRTLGGLIHADLSLDTSRYAYDFEEVRLKRLFRIAKLPAYADGTLSGRGEGIAKAPYSFASILTSYNIRPENPLLDLMGTVSLSPTDEINATNTLTYTDRRIFRDTLQLGSAQFSFDLNESMFDLSNGTFSFSSRFFNKRLKELPVRSILTTGAGCLKDDLLAGDVDVDADAYRFKFEKLKYDAKASSLSTAYFVTTRSTAPFNLSGPNALHGRLAFTDDVFEANLSTRGMAEPLQLRYAGQTASVISYNIPVETLSSILNRPDMVSGYLDLNGSVDLHAKEPALALTATANQIILRNDLAKEMNLTRPGHIKITMIGQKGRYEAKLTTDSPPLIEGGTLDVRYDASLRRANVDGTIKKIKLPWFSSSDITLHTDADLSKRILTDTRIVSPYEMLASPEIDLSAELNAAMHYRIGTLERFIPDANQTAVLMGDAEVHRHATVTDIHLTVAGIGLFDVSLGKEAKQLSATNVHLQKVFGVLGRPAPVRGDVDLSAALEENNGTVTVQSKRLTPSRELNASFRAFPLDARATFDHQKLQHFRGEASLHTAHDTLLLRSFALDLPEKRFDAAFRFEAKDLSRSVVAVPKGLIGNRLTLKGNAHLDAEHQRLSVRTAHLELDRSIHRMVEKNATDTLPVFIDVNVSRSPQLLDVNAAVISDRFMLSPTHADYRFDTSVLSFDALLETDMKIGKTRAVFRGIFDGGTVSHGELNVTARAEALEVTNLRLNPADKEYDADIRLSLAPLDAPDTPKKAVIYGKVQTRPEVSVNIHSESFEGNLSAVMNDNLLVVHASRLSLPQLLHFVSKAPAVTQGIVSGNVILNSPPLLEGNLSRLSGGVDISAHDLRIEGIDIDGYLETLRQTQDLSLFQGSLSELPIVRTVKNLPEDLLSMKVIRTDITQARFGASVTNGMLVCEDCAAATPTHRVAFAGNINLVTRRFDHFYAALLNPKGCPYFMQRINGTLADPKVNLAESGVRVIGGAVVSLASNVTDAANWLTGVIYKVTSATGEVISYVPLAGQTADKALKTVSGTLHGATAVECTPFYIGVIPPPRVK